MARHRRLKSSHPAAVYHCISRTVNGEFLFDDTAKEMLRKHIHQTAEFSGIEVITYAIMSNHFHVLVRILPCDTPDDSELLRRYKALYPNPTRYATAQIAILESTLKANGINAEQLRRQLLARMGNVSEFMKTLKQRFSVWFNRSHKRYGTLWAERFTSTIVEGNRHFALRITAAYIDLNPVRAGLTSDPKDYRWCGYGEAVAIGGRMIQGLRQTIEDAAHYSNGEVLAAYRLSMLGKGAAPKANGERSGIISPELFASAEKCGGVLPLSERLRLRVAWFTRGAVIGSKQFVTEHLSTYLKHINSQRDIKPKHVAPSESDDGQTELFAMRRRA
ncbi:MAG: transposase [Puniceicoccales bacterium]|jgi:REP element-mobilizing transposase RayT|nr:transposase [Puniceicoccales bacterium]